MPKRFKSPNNLIVFFCSALLLLFPGNVIGQSAPVATRDPNAVALAAQSLRAVAGLTPLTDITLQANANFIAGSDEEMGSATLVALGNQLSSVTLNLTNGSRTEVRNGTNGVWSGPDGTQHFMALHNCWVDADWFFPALTLQGLQTDATLGAVYLGATQWNGVAAVQLEFFHIIPWQTADMTAEIQNLSVVDLYLDPKSLLPLAEDYNTHPDNDFIRTIPVEIRFGNYQPVAGVAVPFHMQRYFQGTLVLDLTLTNAAINSGVTAALFAAPERPTGGAQ